MKKFTLIPALAATMLLFSCGGNNNQPAENQTAAPAENTQPSGGGLMDEGPKYDPTKIDAAAPVVDVKVNAVGNTMTEMKYDQTEIRVKAGSTVKLTLTNQGTDEAMQHNLVIIEEGANEKVGKAAITAGPDKKYIPDMREVLVGTDLAGPGKTVTVSFPAPEKGSYDFICTYPGHYTIMHGKLIVE